MTPNCGTSKVTRTAGFLLRTVIMLCSILTPFRVSAANAAIDINPSGCDYNFELQRRFDEELPRELHYAVVQIRDASGDPKGTGYVVDLARGYIITAHHVVKDFVEETDALRITSRRFPRHGSISANVVGELMTTDSLDLALLQSDGEQLRDAGAIALDLQMRIPIVTEVVGILGYPDNRSDDMNGHIGKVSLIRYFDESFIVPQDKDRIKRRAEIVVAQDIWGGHSGSPLISQYNVVIGTAKSQIGDRVGHYIPTSDVFKFVRLMANAGISDNARRLYNIINLPNVSVGDLANVFLSPLTNLELMIWAIDAAQLDPTMGVRLKQFLSCPIQKVYSDRKIEQAYEYLESLLPGGQDLIQDILQAAPE